MTTTTAAGSPTGSGKGARARFRIVAGVDDTPAGRAALRWAVDEARTRDGEVTALYAWEPPSLAYPGDIDPERLERASERFLLRLTQEEVPSPGIPLRPVVVEGDPADVLVHAADDADLVVLGNSGHPHRPGSPRHACNARCACPVVLVKPSASGGEPAHREYPGYERHRAEENRLRQ